MSVRVKKDEKVEMEKVPDVDVNLKHNLKPSLINKARLLAHNTWVGLDENKRNIGASLVGVSKLLVEAGALKAAAIVGPVGWGFLVLGVVHSVFKIEKAKKEEFGYNDLEKLLSLIAKLITSIRKEK